VSACRHRAVGAHGWTRTSVPLRFYYEYIDSIGSLNAIVLHPELSFTISPTVSVSAKHFSFLRTSAADGIYSQPGFFLRCGERVCATTETFYHG
jgi:hypothetical protein